MIISNTIQCGISPKQATVLFQDICREINYESSGKEIAYTTPHGMVCSGWIELPKWVDTVELRMLNNQVKLIVKADLELASTDAETLINKLSKEVNEIFNYKICDYPCKVFCIGWPKTGTTSLTQALRILGLFSWHFPPWLIGCKSYNSNISEMSMNLHSITEYSALSDLPVCVLFRELDEFYPGSKFIFTTRSVESWIDSAISEVQSSINKYGCMPSIIRWAYGIDYIDREAFIRRYMLHQESVSEYFSGRSDILFMDINERSPWQKLCNFLALPAPNVSFPFLNRR